MKEKETTDVERIAAHIERCLGRIVAVFPDPGADEVRDANAPRVLVHLVPSTETRPVHTLITTGMSARAMDVPPDANAPRHIELMMTLPRHWKVDAESMRQGKWRWPVDQLHHLAQLPSRNGTWIGWGQVIANGDPPRPLAAGTDLCGVIVAPSLFVPPEFYELRVGDRAIAIFGAIPLYKEEIALGQEQGMEALLAKLLDHGIQDVIDPRRRNVARKKVLGLF